VDFCVNRGVRVVVLKATFNNIFSFIGGGNRRKPPTFDKVYKILM